MKCPHCGKDVFEARPSVEAVIEHYYRARARGSKITLKDAAEITGFSHSYLREVKSRYDRAGKWGSKK
jgi:hypothetical protein